MTYRTIDALEAKGKRVLLRADLNVPVKDGRITDRTRIERLCPTIAELANDGARVVICSHFDRPKGKRVPEMSLKPLQEALSAALRRPVAWADDCIGPEAEAAVAALKDGEILLLENTRYHAGEEKNDPAMAAALAKLADAFVNDAFSAAHRAHASTEGVARLLPSYAGRLMEAELKALDAALGNPARPVVAIVGGAKVSTKLDLLGNLSKKVDVLVIGGAMANTFLAAQGHAMGKSLQEAEMHDTARAILEEAKSANCEILLPVDLVVAERFEANAPSRKVGIDAVPADSMALDVGPDTEQAIEQRLRGASTLVWNGPLGAFEIPPFDAATVAVAEIVASLTQSGALKSIGGGGDTVAALRHAGVAERMTYISTAGGAFLEWLEGKTLPGVAALSAG
ncbi:phosphoglycerate kinase [Neoroseomonas oryzicola]|uniref:Phosphoglycerate kinase n=1 Tax=Neoroseomonas oryzicola TaxID=535904 RepID=A0A9X9WQ94_9PROT|nr:phosphoglycerate kinase [Neoroseomonas oryzicola]MBR0662504.1 phosphoglycerate kinase [Neoroseomonas oryzicola]NKE16904.1 phosphoglycerate kinase [Neoroseomonas oryzicola]